jgi:hypothetical protein
MDFNALLDKPIDSIERPKPIPTGSYLATLGQPKFDKTTGDKQTDYVEYPVMLQEALPDVDQELLVAALNGKNLTEVTQKITYYLTEAALFRLSDMLKDHAKVTEGLPLREGIQEAVGKQLVVVISHTPNKKDPQSVYANIDQTAAVPE